eukprot:12417123-Karenia_brevis.AAC.1
MSDVDAPQDAQGTKRDSAGRQRSESTSHRGKGFATAIKDGGAGSSTSRFSGNATDNVFAQ